MGSPPEARRFRWGAPIILAVGAAVFLWGAGLGVWMLTRAAVPGPPRLSSSHSALPLAACTPGWMLIGVALPPQDSEDLLFGVSASGSNDAWAVGERFARDSGFPATLAEHWDGRRWTLVTSTITTLPQQLRRSLTWDRGKEMAKHADLRIDTGHEV